MRTAILAFVLITSSAGVGQPVYLRVYTWSGDPFEGTGRTAPTLPGTVSPMPGSALNTPPEGITPLLPSSGGRIWIWATGSLGNPDPYAWIGVSFNVTIQGPATIVGGGMMNVQAPGYLRWETNSDFTTPTFNMVAIRDTTRGVELPPGTDGWDDGAANVLLGYLDLAGNAGYSELFFGVGGAGISRRDGSPTDQRAFGWGDPCSPGPIECPPMPVVIVVPEPAAASLFAMLALLSGRPRRN